MTLDQYIAIAHAADQLESWLHSNAGTSADWLVSITTHDEESTEEVVGRLNALRSALAPFREAVKTDSTTQLST